MSQLNNLRSSMSGVEIPPVEISKVELELPSLVIAHAALNLCFPNLLEHLNQIHLLLKGSLVKEAKNKNQANKRFGHRHVPEVDPAIGDAIFGHGRLMTAIATFQQGHMICIAYAEEFWNSIAEVTLPDLTCVGKQAFAAKDHLDRTISRTTTPLPSIYVGIDVIVNQETPPHLDTISAPSLLDLVFLHHSVPKWEKGERIALAHYMKDMVHSRFGVWRPAFTQQKDILGKFLQA
ncbi:hypothetical protein EDC04DRAFT_2606156 [Pisolithus marmoratus]|nr:hypothetical protein EDC04DRAFT_2606156 [Pisolithus marmoratus]